MMGCDKDSMRGFTVRYLRLAVLFLCLAVIGTPIGFVILGVLASVLLRIFGAPDGVVAAGAWTLWAVFVMACYVWAGYVSVLRTGMSVRLATVFAVIPLSLGLLVYGGAYIMSAPVKGPLDIPHMLGVDWLAGWPVWLPIAAVPFLLTYAGADTAYKRSRQCAERRES